MSTDELKSAEELKELCLEEGVELSDDDLNSIAGGISGGKTKTLVCNVCEFKIAANVAGIQEMTKHCKSSHGKVAYHVE